MEDYREDSDMAKQAEEARIRSIESAMAAEGVATHERVQEDYFGFDETHVITLPDGVSEIYHQTLNEGQRRKYQNALNKDVRISRGSGDAIMKLAPGDEKVALLEAAISGWNLKRDGKAVAFTPQQLRDFLSKANPRIIDLIEKEIRKVNGWLQADMSVEDIDKEIESLQEIRQAKIEEDEGKKALKTK